MQLAEQYNPTYPAFTPPEHYPLAFTQSVKTLIASFQRLWYVYLSNLSYFNLYTIYRSITMVNESK